MVWEHLDGQSECELSRYFSKHFLTRWISVNNSNSGNVNKEKMGRSGEKNITWLEKLPI